MLTRRNLLKLVTAASLSVVVHTLPVQAAEDITITGTISDELRTELTQKIIQPTNDLPQASTFSTLREVGPDVTVITITYSSDKWDNVAAAVRRQISVDKPTTYQVVKPAKKPSGDDFVITSARGFSAHISKSKRGMWRAVVRYAKT